jgi:spermidine/putrescine transport system substrate-binding protein
MKTLIAACAAALITTLLPAEALAAGELQIFNWGNYTNPELIAKFERTHDVKVTITDYDSNDTALAKVRAGGHGYDIVVPSANYVPVWIKEGLLLETRPDQMPNFKHVDPKWADVAFDPGRRYTVPWQWGTVGVLVNTKHYKGDINTWKLIFDPPDMLLAAKPHWLSIDYGSIEKSVQEDYWIGLEWNGGVFRARLQNPAIRFGYPREGYPIWMDNVAVLKDARNVENARLFQDFVMDPENAAMISAFARFANAIPASAQYMPEDMRDAPEVVIPKEFEAAGRFIPACKPETNDLYSKIWTEVLK